MTKEQIINKAINKAIKNGWHEGEAHKNLLLIYPRYAGKTSLMHHYYNSLIFSHDFAKAFFTCTECKGKGFIEKFVDIYPENFNCNCSDWKKCNKCKGKYEKGWEHHIQQMVLEREPLKYLEKFL